MPVEDGLLDEGLDKADSATLLPPDGALDIWKLLDAVIEKATPADYLGPTAIRAIQGFVAESDTETEIMS